MDRGRTFFCKIDITSKTVILLIFFSKRKRTYFCYFSIFLFSLCFEHTSPVVLNNTVVWVSPLLQMMKATVFAESSCFEVFSVIFLCSMTVCRLESCRFLSFIPFSTCFFVDFSNYIVTNDKKYVNKKERERHLPGYCQ